VVELVELRAFNPQNERDLYPIYNSIRGARVLEEAWNLHLGDLKAIFRISEFNVDALNTVSSGPKCLFNVVSARCGRS